MRTFLLATAMLLSVVSPASAKLSVLGFTEPFFNCVV
jgi:hypothetical protein